MPSKGSEIKQGVEKPQGLVSKRLMNVAELGEYWDQIKDLSANALDIGEGGSYGEREEEVEEDHLYNEYLKSENGELYVLLKDDAVVAFLAIKKSIDDNEVEIEQLRLVQGPAQAKYIGEIIEFARKKLEREEGYHHGVATPTAANDNFSDVAKRISRFLRIEEKESPEDLAA